MRGSETPLAEGCRIGWPAIAKAVGVSPATAQRMAAEGQLPVTHNGRRVVTTDRAIELTLTLRALGMEVAELVGMARVLFRHVTREGES